MITIQKLCESVIDYTQRWRFYHNLQGNSAKRNCLDLVKFFNCLIFDILNVGVFLNVMECFNIVVLIYIYFLNFYFAK